MINVMALMLATTIATGGLDFVDPLIGTEGTGTEYGGMMPMAGVPFGSMNLVPVTRTNGVSRTSFNALDRHLLGFILTRQPAIWMGDFGPLRIWLPEPLPIESVKASGNPLDLAKARVLGDAMTNIQKEDGSIRTQWLMRPDADNFWINCLGASIEALELLSEEGE